MLCEAARIDARGSGGCSSVVQERRDASASESAVVDHVDRFVLAVRPPCCSHRRGRLGVVLLVGDDVFVAPARRRRRRRTRPRRTLRVPTLPRGAPAIPVHGATTVPNAPGTVGSWPTPRVRIEHDTMGEVRVPASAEVAGPDPAGGRELPDRRASRCRPRSSTPSPASRGRWPPRTPAPASSCPGRSPPPSRPAAAEVRRRAVGRPVPDRHVPDRLGHLHEHERQRGAGHPGRERPRPRRGPPERRRQRPAVVERPVPRGDPPRRRRADRRPPRSPRSRHLAASSAARQRAFADVVKAGRTHLMDATPVTLGQELGGYATQIEQAADRLRAALPRVGELPLGGSAVGTGINVPAGFAERRRRPAGQGDEAAAHRGRRPHGRTTRRATRSSRLSGLAAGRGRRPRQVRRRHPVDGLGARGRSRRAAPARPAARQLDHARAR